MGTQPRAQAAVDLGGTAGRAAEPSICQHTDPADCQHTGPADALEGTLVAALAPVVAALEVGGKTDWSRQMWRTCS